MILIISRSCALVQPLLTLLNNWNIPKSSKNIKNTSKYVSLSSELWEELSKSVRNIHLPCAKHFIEVYIGFSETPGPIKVYKLDFGIFIISGHSDTISSIWESLKIASRHVKMGKNCNVGGGARAYKIQEIDIISEVKVMIPLSILSTHMSRINTTCWFWSPNLWRNVEIMIFCVLLFGNICGGWNFKSAKQGRSIQKSWKSGFRDNTIYMVSISLRIVTDTKRNV